MHASPGFTNDKISLFLAQDLEESKLELDEDERLDRVSYSLEDLNKKIENGEITDAKTIVAIFYAFNLKHE